MQITTDHIIEAIHNASKGHRWKREVQAMLSGITDYAAMISARISDGSYIEHLQYRHFRKRNTNGKLRDISCPSLFTRVLQHLFLILIQPAYDMRDPHLALNCKPGCGITASDKHKSVLHFMKHVMYDRTDMHYALAIDQRQCYAHVTRALFRKFLKRLTGDKELVDFGVNVCFDGNNFPIGTPTSPPAHHIIMLGFDRWLGGVAPLKVRYADDCLLAFHTIEEAHAAMWRIRNYWWYEMHICAKRHGTRVINLDRDPLSFCGMVVHRTAAGHEKGFTRTRKNILAKCRRCHTAASWASYYGILKHTDSYRTMRTIEDTMKLSELTNRIKIKRENDARHMDMKDLAAVESFTLVSYEVRQDKAGHPNWLKMIVGVPDGAGRYLKYEVHGNYAYLIEFLVACQAQYGNFLPLEDCSISNQCGYIFNDSNQVDLYLS